MWQAGARIAYGVSANLLRDPGFGLGCSSRIRTTALLGLNPDGPLRFCRHPLISHRHRLQQFAYAIQCNQALQVGRKTLER